MADLLKTLQDKKEALAKKWLVRSFETYPKEVSTFLKREKNQFANPVAHSFKTGTSEITDEFLGEMDAEKICRSLEEIIRVRAIQDYAPSHAVTFILLLKQVTRETLGKMAIEPKHASELADLDARVDQIVLYAFDIYVKCREQVFDLRVNEVKRNVSVMLKRFNKSCTDPIPDHGIIEQ